MDEETLNNEIAHLISQLSAITDVEKQKTAIGNIKNLIEIRNELHPKEVEKESVLYKIVSNPAFWGMLSNFGIALLVTKFEVFGIITSKAFGLIRRT